uniref:Desmoplakin SH3 domain-containing protein n=2 Tax=Schistocephalus solidus TaxID=70667 RepID=A0A0X3PLH1_SCHSO
MATELGHQTRSPGASSILMKGINMEHIGDNNRALQQEMDYQEYLAEEMLRTESRGVFTDAELRDLQNKIELNENHLEYLAATTNLENLFSDLTNKISERSVRLSQRLEAPNFWDRNLIRNVRNCWKTVQMFSLASRVHISNAAEYQMFYYICDHFTHAMRKKTVNLFQQIQGFEFNENFASADNAQRFGNLMHESLRQYHSLSAEIHRISEKSQTVVPVYQRVQPLLRPVHGVVLCDYKTNHYGLRAGQHVIVLDNNASPSEIPSCEDQTISSECSCSLTATEMKTDAESPSKASAGIIDDRQQMSELADLDTVPRVPSSLTSSISSSSSSIAEVGCSATFCSHQEERLWKVQTSDGKNELEVPAVCVMLCETDQSAISTAFDLCEQLTRIWADTIDIYLESTVTLLSGYLKYLNTSEHVDVESKMIFEQLLKDIEAAFPAARAPSSEGNRILHELVTSVRRKLNETWTETRELTTRIRVKSSHVASYRRVLQKLKVCFTRH